MIDTFEPDWLALREPFDHAARSVILARRLVQRLPQRPRIVDLGAGTGSMFRYLAPIIGGRQDWLLVDANTGLLDEAFGRTAAWARRRGCTAVATGNELQIATPQGLWRMEVIAADLGEEFPLAADAVVCSALLDLVSARWLDRLFDRMHAPFLASLIVDGRDIWRPRDPFDAQPRAVFRHDQFRDKGIGRALGATAWAHALRSLAARGFVTASAPSDWHIPRTALGMQRALIDGRGANDARWQEVRLRQALRGRLAITIGHRDILAFPPGG
ncbi:MAG TPA: class I SAM-dependent methyltransferase [Acetobacteraceae bacterium]|nr:class I SAM-dependent methyltransferase [Acetobacteraceae bacterium]